MRLATLLLTSLCAIAINLTVALPTAGAAEAERVYLSGRGPADAVEWDFLCSAGRRSGEWTTIPVPSNWEQQGFGAYDYGHVPPEEKSQETGTYRVRFHAPADWKNKVVRLVFEGAMTDTSIKVNGVPVGSVHQGGYTQFHFTLTDTIQYGKHAFQPGQENELEILVAKKSSNATLEAAERKADYWVFGGIYRPVYLEVLPKAFIHRVAIDADANGQFHMQVFPQVHLPRTNNGTDHVDQLVAQIETLKGKPVGSPMSQPLTGGGASRVTLRTKIAEPALWSPESPSLHQVRISLKSEGKTLHETVERFGFRTFEVRPQDGLYLNGKKIRIQGVNRNAFRPDTGRAIDPEEAWEDALAIKAMNANTVRCHIPPSTAFLEACDELGLLFITERSNWQRPVADSAVSRQIVYELVARDHNHPSLVMWANGNEGGFNHEVDELFALLDLQERPVIHPWATFDGINTRHYLNYTGLKNRLATGSNILLPTEFLHGLFDGGAGAGLDDYWELMRSAPLSAGGVIWCWADAAIERTDLNGKLDTDGNHSADGIVGPYGEKEASYYTLREIWSPVQIPLEQLPSDFTGLLPIENRFDQTSLEHCTFHWKLLSYNAPLSETLETSLQASGTLPGPALPPGTAGALQLPLPSDWHSADTLTLAASAANGRELMSWSWSTGPKDPLLTNKKNRLRQDRDNPFQIETGDTLWTFSAENGQLLSCAREGAEIGLGAGPILYAATSDDQISFPENWTAKASARKGSVLIEAANPNGSHFSWTLTADGTATLDYSFARIDQALAYCAVGFDLPEENVVSKRWSGDGPYRIWNNRRKGPQFGHWQNQYNDAIPGSRWNYPSFKGIFANSDWMRIDLDSGNQLFVDPQDHADLGLLRPSNVTAEADKQKTTGPRKAQWAYPPEGGLFLFHKAPAVGTKFKDPAALGPQSEPQAIEGPIAGSARFQVK